jgi:hypothetical protein
MKRKNLAVRLTAFILSVSALAAGVFSFLSFGIASPRNATGVNADSYSQYSSYTVSFGDASWFSAGANKPFVDASGHPSDYWWLPNHVVNNQSVANPQINLSNWPTNSSADKAKVAQVLATYSDLFVNQQPDLVSSFEPIAHGLNVNNNADTTQNNIYYEYDGFATGDTAAAVTSIPASSTLDGRTGVVTNGVGHFPVGGFHFGNKGNNGGVTLQFPIAIHKVTATYGPYLQANEATTNAAYLASYDANGYATDGSNHYGVGIQLGTNSSVGSTSFSKVYPDVAAYTNATTKTYISPVKTNPATAVSGYTDYGDTSTASWTFDSNVYGITVASGSIFSHNSQKGNRIAMYSLTIEVDNVNFFAYRLSKYKTCTEYAAAYAKLNPSYNVFKDQGSETTRLMGISLSDYDYTNASVYNPATQSYVSGGSKTITVSAYTKWQMIVSLATGSSGAGVVLPGSSNSPISSTLIIVAVSGGFTLLSVALIALISRKKRKAPRA